MDKMPTEFTGPVLRGSAEYMSASDRPVPSEAADDLVARAMADRDGPLYVLALGAVTNVASAILSEPAIVNRIVVIPLGGSPYETGSYADMNFTEDVHAVRVLFDSGVPVVHVVGYVVSEMMRTTEPEMARYVKGTGCDRRLSVRPIQGLRVGLSRKEQTHLGHGRRRLAHEP